MTPKITIYTTEYLPYPGGIATYVFEVAREATLAGYDVDVCVFGEYAKTTENTYGFSVSKLSNSAFSIEQLPKMSYLGWRQAAHKPPSILIAADYRCIAALGFLPIRARKIAILHGSEVRGRLFKKLNSLKVYRPLLHFDKVVANSAFTRSLAMKYHPYMDMDRLFAVPLGISQTWFERFSSNDVNLTRIEFGLEREKTILLSVGRIEPRKGLEYAIRAVHDVADSIKADIIYLIVGRIVDVAYSDYLDHEIRLSGADIRRLGVVSLQKLRLLYQCATVMLHTSVPDERTAEGFGLVLLEAAAAGLPVIATRTDAIPEVVSHNQTGFLATPRDVSEISAAISKLVQEPGLRQRMSVAGPAHARKYSWRSHVERVLA
jgi:phosphatidyl-myo-inositol dimannoside synthase